MSSTMIPLLQIRHKGREVNSLIQNLEEPGLKSKQFLTYFCLDRAFLVRKCPTWTRKVETVN